jgi:hypothetical protein
MILRQKDIVLRTLVLRAGRSALSLPYTFEHRGRFCCNHWVFTQSIALVCMGIRLAFLFAFQGNPVRFILALFLGAGILVVSWHISPSN